MIFAAGVAAQGVEPELIERLPGPIDDHSLVMLDGKRAIVAWERDDIAAQETVWASRRTAPGHWSVPEILEFSQGRASTVQLAVDGAGNATVIWVQQELRPSGLWSNRFMPGEGWREPSRIEPVAGELYGPRLALDASGSGFAVWERRQGERLRIRASRHGPAGGWEPPQTIDDGAGDPDAPQIAVHADGGAVAAWNLRGRDGPRRVVASHHVPDKGWGTPFALSAVGEDAYDVRIATDAGGDVFAAWEQEMNGEESIFVSRFEAGAGWSAPVRVEVDGEEGYGPRLAVSPEGSAMVAWIRADGESGAVVAARYTRERGWASPVVVQDGELLYVFDLDIVAGARGEVLATWCQTDGSRNNVWYARFDERMQWHRPALAEHRTGSAHRPRAAVAPDGSFGLLWKIVDAPLPDQALQSLWFREVQ